MPGKTIPPEPTQAELRSMMGKSYAALEAFLETNSDLRPEWKYYGVKLGWSLKLFQGKRNICFLGPHENYLGVAFVLGAKAVETALKSQLPDAVKKQVRESPQYPEGRGIRFVIKLKKDLAPAQMLLEIKKSA